VIQNKIKQAIVFVHGFLGFSAWNILGRRIYYFRALPPRLHALAQPAYFPTLPRAGLIAERAQALAHFLNGIHAERIDLIAHSMGGLDSRYAIHHLDPQQRIRSLTTMASPHRGSPLAQWILDNQLPFSPLLRRISRPGLVDLTPEACARFNAEITDRPDVLYRSYAGHRPVSEIPLIFRPWAKAIQKTEGDNDSQVSVTSAMWGEYQGALRADHLELVGWNLGWPGKDKARPFDHREFYLGLVQQLAACH